MIVCGRIFRDDKACHLGCFCDFMGENNYVIAEFLTVIVAIEKAIFWVGKNFGWKRIVFLWLKLFLTPTWFLGLSYLVGFVVWRIL